jgi:hypothetical protein
MHFKQFGEVLGSVHDAICVWINFVRYTQSKINIKPNNSKKIGTSKPNVQKMTATYWISSESIIVQ